MQGWDANGDMAWPAGRWSQGSPASGASAARVPVSVWMREEGGIETWRRDFGGAAFTSRLAQCGPLLVERFGPLRFGFALRREADGLSMHFARWWLGPLPMPRFLMPRGTAGEYETDGRFHFDFGHSLPSKTYSASGMKAARRP